MSLTYFQDWLKQNIDTFEGPESVAAILLTDRKCPKVRRGFDLVLDYLEDKGYSEQVISASIYLYKRYYVYMAPELSKLQFLTRRAWRLDYNRYVLIRADGNYPEYKPFIVDIDIRTELPMEVKV